MRFTSKSIRRLLCAVIILEVCMLPLAIRQHARNVELASRVQIIAGPAPSSAFDRAVQERAALLRRAKVVGASVAVSNRDVCYKEAKYGGWVTTGYELRCYSRYVQGFAVELDRSTILERLSTWQAASRLFGAGTSWERPPVDGACALYAQDVFFNTLSLLPPQKAGKPPQKVSHYTCSIPDQKRSPRITSGKNMSTKDYAAFNEPAIDRTKPILWMQYEEEYYNERTGCKTVSSSCSNSSSGMRTRTVDKAVR